MCAVEILDIVIISPNASMNPYLLQEAFAVVREASKRVLGLRPFDVQLIGNCLLMLNTVRGPLVSLYKMEILQYPFVEYLLLV